MMSDFSEGLSSETEKHALPSLSSVIKTEFLVLTLFVETDLGVTTLSASAGLNLVVRMKKDNSRKATSHIAVISIFVLFRGTLTFGIFAYFLIKNIRSDAWLFP